MDAKSGGILHLQSFFGGQINIERKSYKKTVGNFADGFCCLVTAVATAAVGAAGMAFTVVMVVMAAAGVGIVVQGAAEEQFHSLVRVTGYASVNGNAGFHQSIAGTAADAAADQHVDALLTQQTGQSTVAAAIGVQNLGGNNLALSHFIDLELGGVAEVLEDVAVFISNCDFHKNAFFR